MRARCDTMANVFKNLIRKEFGDKNYYKYWKKNKVYKGSFR